MTNDPKARAVDALLTALFFDVRLIDILEAAMDETDLDDGRASVLAELHDAVMGVEPRKIAKETS